MLLNMKDLMLFVLVLFSSVLFVRCSDNEQKKDGAGKIIKQVDIYRKLLRTKRGAHREAVATMLKQDEERQYKLVKMMLEQLLKVTNDSKNSLEKLQFKPHDPYPEDETKREALSMVIENTAFLGEIVLHLPDLSHELLQKNKDWDSLIRWCVNFTNDTRILEKKDQKMLHLMAQELNIIEQEENFQNPYREETMMERVVEEEVDKILKEQKKKKERQEKRKKNRGPSLGGARVEL